MNLTEFKTIPLLGILRGIPLSTVDPIAEVSIAAGLKAIEITMNTDSAPKLIKQMHAACNGKMAVGAGTVLTLDALQSALDSGASFIVMPVVIPAIIEYCTDRNIPVFPGALTPNEIYTAWNLGATMVKVFPAAAFGPSYLSEIKGPFNDIELLACGGISTQTLADYFNKGASAAAFGASIFKKEWIETRQYEAIGIEIKRLVDAYLAYLAGK